MSSFLEHPPIYQHPSSIFLSNSGFNYHDPILYDPDNQLRSEIRLKLQKRFGFSIIELKELTELDETYAKDNGGTKEPRQRIVFSTSPTIPVELDVNIRTLWIITSSSYPCLLPYRKSTTDQSVYRLSEKKMVSPLYDCHYVFYPRDINILIAWLCDHEHYISFEKLYQLIPIVSIFSNCPPRKWKRKYCLLPH